MFQTTVKSKVSSDALVGDEITIKHRARAIEALGEHVMVVNTSTAAIPILADDSLKVVGHDHHVLSTWRTMTPDEIARANPT